MRGIVGWVKRSADPTHSSKTPLPRWVFANARPNLRWLDSDLLHSFTRSKLVVAAALVVALVVGAAFLAPLIAPQDSYDLKSLSLIDANLPPAWAAGGDSRYLLGTDDHLVLNDTGSGTLTRRGVSAAITLDATELRRLRDQLDRYGELETIAKKIERALGEIPESAHAVLNGDDPRVAEIGLHLANKPTWLGLDDTSVAAKTLPDMIDSAFMHLPIGWLQVGIVRDMTEDLNALGREDFPQNVLRMWTDSGKLGACHRAGSAQRQVSG